MKKYLIFIIVLAKGLLTYSQIITNDVYEFPLKRGSKEWKQFETIKERIDALQIPNIVLSNISTEGLLETCLSFPYLTDIFFSDNTQLGFVALMNEFNGFQEFFKRKDFTNALLEKYRNLIVDIKSLQSNGSVNKGLFSFRHFVLEFMMAQDDFIKKLDFEQDQKLISLSIEYKKIKQLNPDIYSNLNDLPTYLLYAKKMINDSSFEIKNADLKKDLQNFIKEPRFLNQSVIEYLENYINVKYKL